MATKAFKKLGENPSKADEIEFIGAVREMIPKESYLNTLFSEDFMRWITISIRDDADTNLYEFWQSSARQGNDTNSALVHMRNERDSLKLSLAAAKQDLEECQRQLTETTLITREKEALAQEYCGKYDGANRMREESDRLRIEYAQEAMMLRKMLAAVVLGGDEDLKITARMLAEAYQRGNQ